MIDESQEIQYKEKKSRVLDTNDDTNICCI